jgi:hypothetical protein
MIAAKRRFLVGGLDARTIVTAGAATSTAPKAATNHAVHITDLQNAVTEQQRVAR